MEYRAKPGRGVQRKIGLWHVLDGRTQISVFPRLLVPLERPEYGKTYVTGESCSDKQGSSNQNIGVTIV